MNIKDIKLKIKNFCLTKGYIEIPSFDVIKGAGTFNDVMIQNILKDKPFKFLSEEWSYRINDSTELINEKYCMRLSRHLQLQIMNFPGLDQDLISFFREILRVLDIDEEKYYIQFENSNWSNETIGASGNGYEVRICGLEVAQLTDFKYICGKNISGSKEIAIGIERLASIKQEVDSIFDLKWDDNFNYRDLFFDYERDALEERKTLNKEEIKKEFEEKRELILNLLEKKMHRKAYREFCLLNNIFDKLELCDNKTHLLKRKYIEEMNKISKDIWKKYIQQK